MSKKEGKAHVKFNLKSANKVFLTIAKRESSSLRMPVRQGLASDQLVKAGYPYQLIIISLLYLEESGFITREYTGSNKQDEQDAFNIHLTALGWTKYFDHQMRMRERNYTAALNFMYLIIGAAIPIVYQVVQGFQANASLPVK